MFLEWVGNLYLERHGVQLESGVRNEIIELGNELVDSEGEFEEVFGLEFGGGVAHW